jgi:hypothetical protein
MILPEHLEREVAEIHPDGNLGDITVYIALLVRYGVLFYQLNKSIDKSSFIGSLYLINCKNSDCLLWPNEIIKIKLPKGH